MYLAISHSQKNNKKQVNLTEHNRAIAKSLPENLSKVAKNKPWNNICIRFYYEFSNGRLSITAVAHL